MKASLKRLFAAEQPAPAPKALPEPPQTPEKASRPWWAPDAQVSPVALARTPAAAKPSGPDAKMVALLAAEAKRTKR